MQNLNEIGSSVTSVSFINIDVDTAGQRLDNFLFTNLRGVPKTRVYRLLRKGEIRVNKKRCKPMQKLVDGDVIRIPPIRTSAAAPQVCAPKHLVETIKDSVIYSDKALLVINKPSGVAVHGGSELNFGLIEILRRAFPEEKYLELVHRLDRDTSGCLLIAKKRSMLRQLHEQLRNNSIDKTYLALVKGTVRGPFSVDAPLQKNVLSSNERIVRVSAAGKPALTEFKPIKRIAGTTLVQAKPVTGRTHQIRVHALHAGHPIAGDPKYAETEFNQEMRERGCKRLFLHAHKLKLLLPDEADARVFEAPLPAELQKVID